MLTTNLNTQNTMIYFPHPVYICQISDTHLRQIYTQYTDSLHNKHVSAMIWYDNLLSVIDKNKNDILVKPCLGQFKIVLIHYLPDRQTRRILFHSLYRLNSTYLYYIISLWQTQNTLFVCPVWIRNNCDILSAWQININRPISLSITYLNLNCL